MPPEESVDLGLLRFKVCFLKGKISVGLAVYSFVVDDMSCLQRLRGRSVMSRIKAAMTMQLKRGSYRY